MAPLTNAKLSYRINELVEATGIPRVTINEHLRSGRLKHFKLGAIVLINADDVRQWLADLAATGVRR